ncbi:MAG: 30S ribosomal protein S20 [Candidatus Chisholmbacteria bacterium]|nr:30S ribosomal protein S20 [Candidatus Chisholmbacteria bacterium]
MPITQSAQKSWRRDRRRAGVNARVRGVMKAAVREARQKPSVKKMRVAYRSVDRAAKKGVIHKNKAARLKSRLMRRMKKR